MNKILVPIDFSDNSINALKFAVNIANKSGVDITLFNAYESMIHGYAGILSSSLEYYQSLNQSRREALEEIANTWQGANINFNFLIKEGNFISSIKALTKEKNYNMIIIGTRGSAGFANLLWGSNTLNVISAIDIPVIAVPEKALSQDIRKVLYAFDFSQYDKQNIKDLISFNEYFNAELICLHINTEHKNRIKEYIRLHLLEEKFKFTPIDKINFEFKEEETVVAGLEKYIMNHSIDMIAIMPEERKFIDQLFHTSISKKMILHTKIPVMILRKDNYSSNSSKENE